MCVRVSTFFQDDSREQVVFKKLKKSLVARASVMAEMFAGMADGALVFQLDALYVGLAVLTLAHAVSNKAFWAGCQP